MKSSSVAIGVAFARRVTDAEAGEEVGRLMAHLVDHDLINEELKSQLSVANGRESSSIRSRIYSVII